MVGCFYIYHFDLDTLPRRPVRPMISRTAEPRSAEPHSAKSPGPAGQA